jgi:hypothetical protein
MLIWILNVLSPQDIRDQIMNQDSVFQQKLIAYLEAAHQGEFNHGSMHDVKNRMGVDPHPSPEELDLQASSGHRVPTLTLPSVPPPMCVEAPGHDVLCQYCTSLQKWWVEYEHEINDLWLRTNLHKCRESYQDSVTEAEKKDWRNQGTPKRQGVKPYWERRGCLSKKGV